MTFSPLVWHGLSIIGASKSTLCSSTFGQNIYIIKISARNLITDEKYNNKKIAHPLNLVEAPKFCSYWKIKNPTKKKRDWHWSLAKVLIYFYLNYFLIPIIFGEKIYNEWQFQRYVYISTIYGTLKLEHSVRIPLSAWYF